METKLPVEGSFGNNIRRTIVIAQLWRPEVARHWKYPNFEVFVATSVDVLFKFGEIWPTGNR